MICKRMTREQEELLFERIAPDPGGLVVSDIDALMVQANATGLRYEFRSWLIPRVHPDVRFTVKSWCED